MLRCVRVRAVRLLQLLVSARPLFFVHRLRPVG